jgi:prepilin-type N-terminal cleavage/methylation domain-containing protein/prepilin-type processing-associated H-X9-DG protein
MEMRSVKRQSAFTLVELLVVIGVIAVLISLLLPALSRAREKARIAACASNEHQIMLMFAMYAAQEKGWLPPYCYGANGHATNSAPYYDGKCVEQDPTSFYYNSDVSWRGWDQILVDTVMHSSDAQRDKGVTQGNSPQWYRAFQCPSDGNPRVATGPESGIPPRSYAINQTKWAWGCSDSGSNSAGKGYSMPWSPGTPPGGALGTGVPFLVVQKRLSQVPYWIWILGENWGTSGTYGVWNNNNGSATNGGYGTFPSTPTDFAVFGNDANGCLDGSPARFHGYNAKWYSSTNSGTNGGNYGFADGHVEFMMWNDVAHWRSDTDYRSTAMMQDHWKWYRDR